MTDKGCRGDITAACPQAQRCQTTEKAPKVIKNSPKCHPPPLKYRGPDLSPPIRETERFVELTFHSIYTHNYGCCSDQQPVNNVIKIYSSATDNIRYSQPVWLVCWLIHLPGCFWRWVSGSWTPPRSRCPSPAGYTAGRLKKLRRAAPRLCLTERRVGINSETLSWDRTVRYSTYTISFWTFQTDPIKIK